MTSSSFDLARNFFSCSKKTAWDTLLLVSAFFSDRSVNNVSRPRVQYFLSCPSCTPSCSTFRTNMQIFRRIISNSVFWYQVASNSSSSNSSRVMDLRTRTLSQKDTVFFVKRPRFLPLVGCCPGSVEGDRETVRLCLRSAMFSSFKERGELMIGAIGTDLEEEVHILLCEYDVCKNL